MKSVHLGKVSKIGDKIFANCGCLVFIDLSKVSYIGKSAFRNTAIVKADLRSLKYIFSDTFLYSDLEEITLSSKCKNIEDGAFGECNQLKK